MSSKILPSNQGCKAVYSNPGQAGGKREPLTDHWTKLGVLGHSAGWVRRSTSSRVTWATYLANSRTNQWDAETLNWMFRIDWVMWAKWWRQRSVQYTKGTEMEKNSKKCTVCITEYTSEWEHLGPDMKSLKCCSGEPTFCSLEKKRCTWFLEK